MTDSQNVLHFQTLEALLASREWQIMRSKCLKYWTDNGHDKSTDGQAHERVISSFARAILSKFSVSDASKNELNDKIVLELRLDLGLSDLSIDDDFIDISETVTVDVINDDKGATDDSFVLRNTDDSINVGNIKIYYADKSFGFISRRDGPDIFFHKSDYGGDLAHCLPGASVQFSVRSGPKGLQAAEIKVLGAPPTVQDPVSIGQSASRQTTAVPARSKPEEETGRPPEFQELTRIMRDRKIKPGRKLSTWSRIVIDDIIIYKKDQSGTSTNEVNNIISSQVPSLASIALEEVWCFKYDTDKLSILKNYIKFTFIRLAREGKVAFSGDYAAFNTGLVDNLYEPIYGLFKRRRDTSTDTRPYDFFDWCVVGKGSSGKLLMSKFSIRPAAASYFTRIEDVIFDDKCELTIQWDHVLEDAIARARFPSGFLKNHLPKGFRWDDSADNRVLLRDYASSLSSDPQTKRSIRNRMDDAIQLARKRASWNYKTAIPSYYPTHNKMSILLPLALTDDNVVDLALVVDRLNEREYYGVTVYPLDMAYKGARLVCRPDSDWLRPETAEQAAGDDDDDPDE